jgi:hypothetical protein
MICRNSQRGLTISLFVTIIGRSIPIDAGSRHQGAVRRGARIAGIRRLQSGRSQRGGEDARIGGQKSPGKSKVKKGSELFDLSEESA